MFQPASEKLNRAAPKAQEYKIPASVKGWYKRQPITEMDEQAAVQLDNWFPEPAALRLRYGSQKYCKLTNEAGHPVETLIAFLAGTPNAKLLAAVGGKIYDATTGGTNTTPLLTGYTINRWQYTNFATPAGQFVVCVNGGDNPFVFDGGNFSYPTITGPVNQKYLVNIFSFMNRLFFMEAGSANVWYLPTFQWQGAATSLPLGAYLAKGGAIVAGGQWTFATGMNIQNLCCFVSSEGEVIVFSGTDPSSTSTWSKVGQFTIGRPIGYRCILPINSDMVVLCEDGLMPMSKAMQYDRGAAAKEAFTWNILKAFADAYQAYGNIFGWQIASYPWNHMAIINVPQVAGAGGVSVQFVMDVLTGAWCQYVGENAACWACLQDRLYFGGTDGNVWQAEVGSSDDNQPIAATWVSAYNDLGVKGRLKNALAIRTVFLADRGINPYVGVAIDYDYAPPPAQPCTVAPGGSLWDYAIWDQSTWGSPNNTQANWVTAIGDGYQHAAVCTINSIGAIPASPVNVQITAAYILFEAGTFVG